MTAHPRAQRHETRALSATNVDKSAILHAHASMPRTRPVVAVEVAVASEVVVEAAHQATELVDRISSAIVVEGESCSYLSGTQTSVDHLTNAKQLRPYVTRRKSYGKPMVLLSSADLLCSARKAQSAITVCDFAPICTCES